jgi:hypothetical protein
MDLTFSALILALLSIALVDSINPSALFVTGYILTKAPPFVKFRAVFMYVAGIFCLYFTIGVLLTIGLSALLGIASGLLESRPIYILQALIGVVLFVWSWFPPKPESHTGRLKPTHFSLKAMFVLGIIITLVEFITALPYLAAIGLLQQADITLPTKLGMLAGYNTIFILPPLVLAAFYKLNRTRFERWLKERQAKRKGKSNDTMQWVVGIIGFMLLLNALGSLLRPLPLSLY